MKTVTTKSGYTVSVDEECLDNMELIDALAELQNNEMTLPRVVNMIFTAEDKKRLYDHVRTEDGRVPVQRFTEEFSEVLGMLGKN